MENVVLKKRKNILNNKTKRRLLKDYKKVLNENKILLKEKHNLNIDWVYRLWKVYSVPIEEKYNIYQYGNKYLNELVKKDLAEIDKTMMQLGLLEIVGIMNADVIDDFNVRIVISYKHFNLAKRMNKLILTGVITFFSLLITGIFLISL